MRRSFKECALLLSFSLRTGERAYSRREPEGNEAAMSSLHAILQSSASLVSHIDTQGLPSLHRNIAQLEEESRRLARANGGGGGGGGVVTAQTEAEAQIFLSSRGIDVGKHSRQLRKIDLSKVCLFVLCRAPPPARPPPPLTPRPPPARPTSPSTPSPTSRSRGSCSTSTRCSCRPPSRRAPR